MCHFAIADHHVPLYLCAILPLLIIMFLGSLCAIFAIVVIMLLGYLCAIYISASHHVPYIMRSFKIYTLYWILLMQADMKDIMDMECSMHGCCEKCIQNCSHNPEAVL